MLIPREWDVASPFDQFSAAREASDRARPESSDPPLANRLGGAQKATQCVSLIPSQLVVVGDSRRPLV
jgi:hypothetical protein